MRATSFDVGREPVESRDRAERAIRSPDRAGRAGREPARERQRQHVHQPHLLHREVVPRQQLVRRALVVQPVVLIAPW